MKKGETLKWMGGTYRKSSPSYKNQRKMAVLYFFAKQKKKMMVEVLVSYTTIIYSDLVFIQLIN